MIKQNISKILDTEMERKDFLKLVGIGAVAAIGLGQIVKAIGGHTSQPKTTQVKSQGYGSMAYGGAKSTNA